MKVFREKRPYTMERLSEVLKASPEVAPDVRKSFELLLGATTGHRIVKYGTRYVLVPVFQTLGEATKSPAVKDNASLIGSGVAGAITLTGVLFLRGKWTRAIAWGGLFQCVEAGLDTIESLILGVK